MIRFSITSFAFIPNNHCAKKQRRGPRGGVVEPFPMKLYKMLTEAQKTGFEDLVSWRPHGRCFVIHKTKLFVEKVLPRFFNQSKFTSFQRQLNLYGFRRLTRGTDTGGYYHELFLCGRADLCKGMLRQKIKGTGTKMAFLPASEPNFYCMEYCVDKENARTSSTASSKKMHNVISQAEEHCKVLGLQSETTTTLTESSCKGSQTAPSAPREAKSDNEPQSKNEKSTSHIKVGSKLSAPYEYNVNSPQDALAVMQPDTSPTSQNRLLKTSTNMVNTITSETKNSKVPLSSISQDVSLSHPTELCMISDDVDFLPHLPEIDFPCHIEVSKRFPASSMEQTTISSSSIIEERNYFYLADGMQLQRRSSFHYMPFSDSIHFPLVDAMMNEGILEGLNDAERLILEDLEKWKEMREWKL